MNAIKTISLKEWDEASTEQRSDWLRQGVLTDRIPLTPSQKYVLQWMDDRNLGTVLFEGDYRFPEAFRRNAKMARRFYLKIRNS